MDLEFDSKSLLIRKAWNYKYVVLTLIFSFICIVFWSFYELSNLGFDFGIYYTNARFISDDYKLYDQIFEHKGPFYYFFLRILGYLLGWGIIQSIFALIISLLVFFVPIYILILKIQRTNQAKILLILMATALLIGQQSNSSISFFQEGLLILSFSFILFGNLNFFNFIFLQLFYWLAFFTRVDSIIFFPIILLYLLNFCHHKQSLNKNILKLSIFILMPLSIYTFLSSYFDFTFIQFWNHNFEFNSWYRDLNIGDSLFKKVYKFIYRPSIFLYGAQTFVIPYILYFFGKDIKFLISKDKKIGTIFKFIRFKNPNYEFYIFIVSFFGYLLTNSFKNYYALILLCPGLLFVIKKFSLKANYSKLATLPIIIFLISLNISGVHENIKGTFNGFSFIPPFQKTVDYVKFNKLSEIELVGGRGWPYLISDATPKRAILDWWFYKPNNPYITSGLLNQHNSLINRDSGYIFWIDTKLCNEENNRFLNEVLSKANKIENQGTYTMFRIK